jgi:hypothetical protein
MSVILEQRCPICQSTKDFRPRLGMCSECRDDELLIKITLIHQDVRAKLGKGEVTVTIQEEAS